MSSKFLWSPNNSATRYAVGQKAVFQSVVKFTGSQQELYQRTPPVFTPWAALANVSHLFTGNAFVEWLLPGKQLLGQHCVERVLFITPCIYSSK
jgi:hypothetical protein